MNHQTSIEPKEKTKGKPGKEGTPVELSRRGDGSMDYVLDFQSDVQVSFFRKLKINLQTRRILRQLQQEVASADQYFWQMMSSVRSGRDARGRRVYSVPRGKAYATIKANYAKLHRERIEEAKNRAMSNLARIDVKIHFLQALFVFLISGLLACGADAAKHCPIKLAVAPDISQSADLHGVPRLSARDLDDLVAICQQVGGSFNFLSIKDKSNTPIRRLGFQALTGTLKEQAQLVQQQRSAIETWTREVSKELQAPRVARRTDFWGAMHRLKRLFDEPTLRAQPYRKICVIVSDCIDDAKKFPAIGMPDDVTVLIVGRAEGYDVQGLSPNVYEFESIAAATDYIKALAFQQFK